MKILEWILAKIPREHIYISGPMTGMIDHNRPAFNRAKRQLSHLGHKVVSPADFSDIKWELCLTRDLIVMLLLCDRIVVLPGWKKSKGASLEVHVGKQVGMKVSTLDSALKKVKLEVV